MKSIKKVVMAVVFGAICFIIPGYTLFAETIKTSDGKIIDCDVARNNPNYLEGMLYSDGLSYDDYLNIRGYLGDEYITTVSLVNFN